MEKNHSMSRVERSRREKVTRYSVRKVSFGAASVAVAAFFMFLGNGAVYAAEPNVTATDPALAATPANNQLDENSGASDSTAPKAQAGTTTPTPVDANSTSVESAPASKVQDETPAPTPVAESASVTPAPASSTEEVEEKATPALDKKQLEDYVAEIDAKLASGSYATKTDESVAILKEHLELAKLALTTATSQEELTKAYRKLFMTASSGLRSKPKAQVGSPKLDTTEGKATVGKKANNTERATGSNSIANSGQHDPRNGQALDRNNPFRTDATTTDTDPDANQVFEEPSANEDVDGLLTKLNGLSNVINNETKLANMDQVAATKNIDPGVAKELDEFGGWKAVKDSEGRGRFVVVRKTADGVFPIETVNTVKQNVSTNRTWTSESVLDRGNEHVLLLSEVRTQATKDQEVFDKTKYIENNEGDKIARGLTGYNGIEKTFKAFSPTVGSTTKVSFKTGYTGDINGSKAKYQVEVLGRTDETSPLVSLYKVTFDPSKDSDTIDMKVIAAKDGSSSSFTTPRSSTSREELNTKLAERGKSPNGTTGTFTSKDIEIPTGYTEYTVRISSADNTRLGMGYQIPWRHFALPVAGLEFSITQDTKKVAKDLLTKVYTKLTEQKSEDTKWSTPETKANYEAKLQAIREALTSDASTTDSYKTVAIHAVAQQKKLNEEEKIKNKSKAAVAAALAAKENAIEGNSKLSEAEKTAAKAEAKKAADDATKAIEAAND
ncbi:YSIRK-type signal peptide-containing protein, partial [Anaerococcus sp.]|uniref:YSIRK-type signal peptide-containing protein n=2 Tax=Bacillota TaxID=1239 RepID=UPI0028FFDCF0